MIKIAPKIKMAEIFEYCPFLDENRVIKIKCEYENLRSTGRLEPGTEYTPNCPEANKCSFYRDCPIVEKAKELKL